MRRPLVLLPLVAALLLTTAPAQAATVVRPPKAYVSVSIGNWGMEIWLKFNRTETRRIANSITLTGLSGFTAAFCSAIPGGNRTLPIKASCGTVALVSYNRLKSIFTEADRANRCVRVSYPPLFPLPNPRPFSKVVSC